MVGGIVIASIFSHLVFATVSRARHNNKLATSNSDVAIEADSESLVLIVLP